MILEKPFYSVRDLQDMSSESEACWRKRLGRGELPFVKFGQNVRILREDLQKWIESRTVRKAPSNSNLNFVGGN